MNAVDEDHRAHLLEELGQIQQAVRTTTECRKILDESWFDHVRQHIERAATEDDLASDRLVLFWTMLHPFREAPWFEDAQERRNRGLPVHEQASQLAYSMIGPDPLRSLLPRIECRLTGLRRCGIDDKVIQKKLAEIRANRLHPNVVQHLFEASVLGHFAENGTLKRIEPPPSGVDGAVELDGRLVYVEATHTKQELFPRGAGFFSVSSSWIVDSVRLKIDKKIAHGKQIAKITDAPAMLFLGLNGNGPGQFEAGLAVQELFNAPEGSKLSGVVLSDSWKLLGTEFWVNRSAAHRLSTVEVERLGSWFGAPR